MRFNAIIRESRQKSKWWPVIFWAAFIFLGSSLPPIRVAPDTLIDFLIHKSVHLIEYAVLSGLTWRAARDFKISLFFPVLYAFTDEIHQRLVSGRSGRWQDLLWDSAAIVLGNLVIFYLVRRGWRGNRGISRSSGETRQLAKNILARLKSRHVVALYGDLGSGKTAFVQGLAGALGVEGTINSPSFVFIREYAVPAGTNGFHRLVHVDLYRTKNREEVKNLMLAEYTADPCNLVIVEWAERWGDSLPAGALKIYLGYAGEQRRCWRVEES